MLEKKDVERIWADTFALAKPFFVSGEFKPKSTKEKGAKYPIEEWPEFWPGFNESVKERESLRAHIENGYFPERLYRFRAPNATEEEHEYIENNHKQVTLSVYSDYENTILRAANENNWNIDYSPKSDTESPQQEEFKEYVTTGITEFGSVLGYIKHVLPRIKTTDAMGVIATFPEEIAAIEQDGKMVIDGNKMIAPVPQYFCVEDVWGFAYDKWYLLRSEEKSVVQYGGKFVREGLVMLLIDDQNIWKIEQTGKKIDLEFKIGIWFEHELGFAPCMHLRGVPVVKKKKLRWQSRYLPAREHLDIVLLDSSFLQLSKATGVFPYRAMLGDDCDFIDKDGITPCKGGRLIFQGDQGIYTKECPACKGSGMKTRLSPAGVMLIKPPDLRDGTQGSIVPDAIKWTSPEVHTLEFLRQEMKDNEDAARKLMHLTTEQPMAGGDAKTATEAGLGVRAMYAFIKPESDQIFEIFEFILNCIGGIRYGEAYKGVDLRKPTTFDIRTEADMMVELKDAVNTPGMPPAMIDHLFMSYISARLGHDPKALQMFNTLALADRIFSMNFATIQAQKGEGIIEPWQVVLHYQGVALYDQLAKDGQLTGDLDKDAEALVKLAQSETPEAPADPKLELLNSKAAA